MIGKKAQSGDYLAFMIFLFVLIFFFILSFMIIPPKGSEKVKHSVQMQMGDVSKNLLLYGFLRQEIDGKSMIYLIGRSYTEGEYSELKGEAVDILKNIQKDINFKIYINDKQAVKECTTGCKGKSEEFTAYLPVPNKEVINFRLVLYENR